MSTWTSKVAVAAALAGLAACQPGAGLSPSGGASARPVAVLDGNLQIAGPRGYCPDAASLRETADSAVLLLGRCRADNGRAPAVLTVTAGAPGSAVAMASGGEALAAFFASDAGRATLSRNGRAEDVSVGTPFLADDLFVVRVEDRAVGTYWRGMLAVGGRLVSVSANGPDLPPPAGRALVEQTAAALRRANPLR